MIKNVVFFKTKFTTDSHSRHAFFNKTMFEQCLKDKKIKNNEKYKKRVDIDNC